LRVMSELLDKRGRYESTVISFDPAFVAHTLPALLHSDPGNSLPPWVLDPTPELRELAMLFSERVQAQASERILELRLQEMAIVLGEAHPETKRMLASALLQSHGRETHRLRHVMEKHAYEPLRLSDYATLCGRSLASFKRDFKRVYNCPPGQWLIEKRLAKAAELLKKGDQRVTDVCLDCGFGHLSHFIRTFREAFGASPKQFQLQAQRGTP
ncbi:MAG: AraC family transcriptional regulator, partial [Myxococcota bacterium]